MPLVARSLDVSMRQVSRCVDHTIAVILEMRREARARGDYATPFRCWVISIDEPAALATRVRSLTEATKHVSGAEIDAKSRLPAIAVYLMKAIFE